MRAIPQNSTCLDAWDYLPFLESPLRTREDDDEPLQRIWGDLLPQRHLTATPTGRHALWYFLEAAGLPEGSEVLVGAYNFYVIVRLLIQRGLRPVFVDSDPDTLSMDAAQLRARITPRTRLVLLTHMFGIPGDLDEITTICREHGLLLFEDCAHAVGSRHKGRQVGLLSDGALFSFGVEKMINCFGGGMLALDPSLGRFEPPPHPTPWVESAMDTSSRALITLLMSPSVYGLLLRPGEKLADKLARAGLPWFSRLLCPSRDDPDYRFDSRSRAPHQAFMKKMQRRQLARLDENLRRRRQRVDEMKAALREVPEVRLLREDKFGRWNGSYFGILVEEAHALALFLQERGIGANDREFLDCAGLEQFRDFAAHCPVAAEQEARIVRLPSYPGLTAAQAAAIAAAIRQFFTGRRRRARARSNPGGTAQ